jgi:outer membrane lipoprotein carrier protein
MGSIMNRALSYNVVLGMVLCFLLLPAVSLAETAISLQEVLRGVESHYQQIKAYTASFKQVTSSAASSLTTEASGRLYYQKPKQMRWEYQTPDVQTFIVNNKLAWLHVPAEKQITLFDAQSFFSSPLSQTFFDGVFELQRQFHVALDHSQSSTTSAALALTPKVEDPNIQSMRLYIDLASYRILSIETKDALGNSNRITLESQKEQVKLEQKLFHLEAPPSTTVIDQGGRTLNREEIDKLIHQTQ